jgi:UDP-N-acetylglucosamine 1-carboxyvinyltransferase
MALFRITGQQPLNGTIQISGRKNAAVKLIAAAVLSDQPVTLHRVPQISDVKVMITIFEALGGTVESHGETLTLNASGISSQEIPYELGRKLRASLVFVGPLLARFGTVRFPHPGGCVIGKRSIRPHLDAFAQLGATVDFDGSWYTVHGALTGHEVYLTERSVTGTENLIMAASHAAGPTTLYNAAQETHIENLCDLLRKMGHGIQGDGSSTITITPNQGSAQPAEVTVVPDEIEIGTFAVASLVTQGSLRLEGVGPRVGLLPILAKLDAFNAQYRYDATDQSLTVLPSPNLTAADVQTNPWPGFPPDLQSPFTVLATQATGTSLIHDWMYEGRLYFVDLLQRMEANITICDPHRAIVHGPTPLHRSTSISPDLRAGAALVLAALAAEGESVVEHAELIDRGYAALDSRLRAVGAQITRED